MELVVALLQLLPTGTLEGNLEKGLSACRKARSMGADIALFPEMWSTGYQFPPQGDGPAIPKDHSFLQAFQGLARELSMAIGITYLEEFSPLPRNSFALFDFQGRRVLDYAKVHTCDFGEECALTPGDSFPVTTLETPKGPVKVGCMICYDREFPESARLLMLGGAEIILTPNACPMESNRISQLRGRAYENMLGIATVNYPMGHPDCNGHSTAFDGMAYLERENGQIEGRDTLVLEAGEGEGIYLAPFPLDQMRQYRETEVHGNAYRRPNLYQALTSPKVSPPFVRKDARR